MEKSSKKSTAKIIHKGIPVVEGKQTALGLYLTAKEAYEKWKKNPDKIKVLDVRTLEEYGFVGHAEMAWNIPIANISRKWDKVKNRFVIVPNVQFVDQVKSWAKPGEEILIMCRSGGRSAIACNLLAGAGFTKTTNIIDGFEGDLVDDPESLFQGKRMKNGWKNSGVPWTYENNPEQITLT